ncbi:hypothetical protein A9Q81_12940 [Gammaproteobacteria bacterium 42_54_T18]|nr:hypothetical protein A9Q81_12940 [Gammaproteobacteria bacterium 42_54_T18]
MDVSTREKQVVFLIASGCSNKIIAKKLFVSCNTVRKHRQNIYKKLDSRNTSALIAAAIDKGVLTTIDLERLEVIKEPITLVEASSREQDILRLVVQGLAPMEMAENLGVKYSTVRKHIENIYDKYKIDNQAQLTIIARYAVA